MKKIFILIFSLLIFSFSFSWEKVQQDDEFGDSMSLYMLSQPIKEGFGNLMIGKGQNGERACLFILPNDNLGFEKSKLKMKSKHGVDTLDIQTSGNMMMIYEYDARTLLLALRDSNIVKFNFNGASFSVSAAGFTKAYKNAYWQDFDSSKPVNKPKKGEKVWSLVEGEGYLEAEDAIWD